MGDKGRKEQHKKQKQDVVKKDQKAQKAKEKQETQPPDSLLTRANGKPN